MSNSIAKIEVSKGYVDSQVKIPKARRYYAVEYGVKADNVTDDTVALQACIDDAASVATADLRTEVILPHGVIRTRQTDQVLIGDGKHSITLRSNVNLTGQGIGSTVIKLLDSTKADTPVLLAAAGDSTNITIRNLTIDGNKTRPLVGGEDEGIDFKTSFNAVITDVEVRNCWMDGIDLDGGVGFIATNLLIKGNGGCGMHLAGAGVEHCTITNCLIEDNGFNRILDADPEVAQDASGFSTLGGKYNTISNCTFKNNVRAICNNGGRTQMTSLQIQQEVGNGLPAIYCIGTFTESSSSIDNCKFQVSGAPAILADEGHYAVHANNCTFFGDGAGADGIVVTSGRKVVVTGCVFNIIRHGVHLVTTNGEPAIISDNLFMASNSGNAIRVEAGTVGGTISGNFFQPNTGGTVIDLRGTAIGWQVSNNISTNTSTFARTFGSSATDNQFLDNVATGKIELQSGNNLVRGNKLTNITFTGAITGNVIVDNNITTNLTFSTATYANQSFRANYGTGVTGLFKGTATLTAGTVTINTAAVHGGNAIKVYRQSDNSSTNIGSLSVGTVTTGTSFVINSLDSTASVEAGDTSAIYWEIEN